MTDLAAALATIPASAWSTPSDYADNQIHHLYSRCPLIAAGQWAPWAEPFRPWLNAYDVHDAWLSRIQPGGYIVPHTDASRWRERWQIPIQPAGSTLITDDETLEETEVAGEAGVPFKVKQWLPHAVVNDSDGDRIHLILDTTTYTGPTQPAPFRTLS